MVDREDVLNFIQEKLDFLDNNVVTDGVHSVSINDQVIELLNNIKDYVESLEDCYPSAE